MELFIAGFIFGGIVGVTVSAVMNVAAKDEENEEDDEG